MSSLRIVHVLTHDDATRGGAIQALLLAKLQIDAGHSVRIFVNEKSSAPFHRTFDPWLARGLQIESLDLGATGIASPLEAIRFRRLVEDFKADVVHAHRDIALTFCWLALAGSDVPLVSQRGTTREFHNALVGHIHRSRRVSRFVAVSHAVRDALISYGVDGDRIDVVYGSFDISRFDPDRVPREGVRQELGLGSSQPLIVQVGEIQPKKGPLHFVEVAARVHALRPDCVFALVGRGSERKKVLRRISELGLDGVVRVLGFRGDIPEVYAAADIAVNCSIKNEGLSGSVREALAMRKPTVATRTDGNPEIVIHEESGLLVPPGDDSAMAAAIVRLVEDRDLGERLGARGSEIVRSLMLPEQRLRRMEASYRLSMRDRLPSLASSLHAASGGSPGTANSISGDGAESRYVESSRALARARKRALKSTIRRASVLTLVASAVVVFPLIATLEIRGAERSVNEILQDGMGGMAELQDLMQDISDLRSGVLELVLDRSREDSSRVSALMRKRESFRENAIQLEVVKIERITGDESEGRAQRSMLAADESVARLLNLVSDSEMRADALMSSALDASAALDDAAGELNQLTAWVSSNAASVDRSVPESLARARYSTLLLAMFALIGISLWLFERITRPRSSRE